MTYLAAAVAVVALVGYVAFDWRFGESDGLVPLVLGGAAAAFAVGWTIYRRV